MAAIKVIYWSQSGNTQAMANAVAEGIKEAGKEAEAVFVTEANINDIKDDTAVALGCPAMGAEVLEEADMEPFVTSFESIAAGKNVALFGSYGWGDGKWMRDWAEDATAKGARLYDEGLIVNGAPSGSECKDYGAGFAKF